MRSSSSGATETIRATADAYGGRFLHQMPGGDWGATERNAALDAPCSTDYLTFLDDDDCAAPGARQTITAALAGSPGQPAIFRMAGASGVLWQTPEFRSGNVGTPMFVVPADAKRLGRWTSVYEGDFGFITSCLWPAAEFVWRPEVIALVRP